MNHVLEVLKDEQKMKELRETNMEHLLKRREIKPWNQQNKLVLPAPQISDSELQDVVKENFRKNIKRRHKNKSSGRYIHMRLILFKQKVK